jgi:hypothetical protein
MKLNARRWNMFSACFDRMEISGGKTWVLCSYSPLKNKEICSHHKPSLGPETVSSCFLLHKPGIWPAGLYLEAGFSSQWILETKKLNFLSPYLLKELHTVIMSSFLLLLAYAESKILLKTISSSKIYHKHCYSSSLKWR